MSHWRGTVNGFLEQIERILTGLIRSIRSRDPVAIHLQPDRVGQAKSGDNPFERNNRRALYSALICGIDRLRLVVLWDGKAGLGPGGTAHMVQEVRRPGGIVEHLNTTKFDYWKAKGKVGRALDILAKG